MKLMNSQEMKAIFGGEPSDCGVLRRIRNNMERTGDSAELEKVKQYVSDRCDPEDETAEDDTQQSQNTSDETQVYGDGCIPGIPF